MNIGLLGGTFDPIHQAHVHIALRVLDLFSLDQVWFLVARIPPHKQKKEITSGYHRYAMAALALQNEARLFASSWELDRPGPSYTIDTLEELSGKQPDDRFCFIAGSDSLEEIHSWKDYGKLLLEHCFIFVQRPGYNIEVKTLGLPGSLKELIQPVCSDTPHAPQPGRSFLVNLYAPPVSSTSIRKSIAAGVLPGPDCLSPAVLAYIVKNRLYEYKPSGSEESLRSH